MYSYRDAWAEISLDDLAFNVYAFKSHCNKSRLMTVVKADAYGHGAIKVAQTAIQAGADYLGVAFLDEALELRFAGIQHPILILGYTPVQSIAAAIRHRITLTVFSEEVLNDILLKAEALQQQAIVHIKMDTGLGRLGTASVEQTVELVRKALLLDRVYIEGIFTHFADSDNEDDSYTQLQFQRFSDVLLLLKKERLTIPLTHCCNSAAAVRFSKMHLDMVRIGIGLYGLLSLDLQTQYSFFLRQALQWKTKISSLKTIRPNHPVGYGCTFKAAEEKVMAVIPVGYADGYSRALSNVGTALIHDQYVPIAGRICMDQTILDVTQVPNVSVGDEVILLGGSANHFISVDEVAHLIKTINYEVVCNVGKRVPRYYTIGGHQTAERNDVLDTFFSSS
ncbi:alanine racemase [Paenibacillus sp. GP183]|uniref:alanine racemase n=1 Tax=Paenibacillus sp. GP183 TaxID=1882751 RepID=UPI0008959BDA|nr:alanine racemase [Paenibacillus sp. GP183]SEB48770.1 alanine racemase [Paenibacillus sp. GP183]